MRATLEKKEGKISLIIEPENYDHMTKVVLADLARQVMKGKLKSEWSSVGNNSEIADECLKVVFSADEADK